MPDAKPLSFGGFREGLLEQIGAKKGARHHEEELWESDEQESSDDLTTVVKLKIHPAEKHALSRIGPVLKFGRMANLTMKAEIDHGRITVAEPEKLPVTG